MKKAHFFTKFFQVGHIKVSTRAKIGICAKIEKLPHLPISTILLHHQLNFTATSILTFHISAFIANECININFKSFEVITNWSLLQDRGIEDLNKMTKWGQILYENIAKGTTDRRVEFLSQVENKSRSNFIFRISTKQISTKHQPVHKN